MKTSTRGESPLSATICSRSFRAGDTVHHAPSGEDWLLATDEENGKVQACGWPESMAEAKDCQLLEPASDSERLDMLKTWAAEGKGYEHERDSRTRTARRQLSSENDQLHTPPSEGEEYQKFVEEMAKDCLCADGPCDSCLSGAPCDAPLDPIWDSGLDEDDRFDDQNDQRVAPPGSGQPDTQKGN